MRVLADNEVLLAMTQIERTMGTSKVA